MKCSSSISCLVWKRVLYFPFASVGTNSSSRRRRSRRRWNNKHKAVSFVRSITTDWLFHSLSHVVFLFFIAFQFKSMFDFLPICEFARLWQSNCLLIFIKSWSEFHQHIFRYSWWETNNNKPLTWFVTKSSWHFIYDKIHEKETKRHRLLSEYERQRTRPHLEKENELWEGMKVSHVKSKCVFSYLSQLTHDEHDSSSSLSF